MKNAVAVFHDYNKAEQAILELKKIGLGDDDISVVSTTPKGEIKTTDAAGDSAASGLASGALTGGAVGAIAGLAVANGILPGLGTLFVAGPLATALGFTGGAATVAAGAFTGAAAGGIIGALTGLGMGESEAREYEERIKSGDIVVIATSTDPEVKKVLSRHGAEDVKEYEK